KQPHYLLEFIIMLEEKANKSNKYCVCKECISGFLYVEAEKSKFYSESEQEEILEKSDKSVLVASNQNSDDNSPKASLSKNLTVNVRKNTIDHYCLWPLDKDQQKHLEQLILKATVSLENPEVKALVEFIYPLIKLPSQKQLTTKIEENDNNFPRNILFNISRYSFGWVYQVIKDIPDEELKDYLMHKKVLAMCQLRSELLRSRNITAIDKSLKTYKQNISIPPENNEQISLEDSEEELSDDENDIVGSIEQPEIVKRITMLQDDIHPADNLAAKWKLADIFVDSLIRSASINLLLGD
ncbi:16809_t:CDS:2, partial [Gigaspora margarita]